MSGVGVMGMSRFSPERQRTAVSVGESLRLIRELQQLSQNQLAEQTGIPRPDISAIENGRMTPDAERTKMLARVLKCHPDVLAFSGPGMH